MQPKHTARAFLKKKRPKKVYVLEPILQRGGALLIYGPTGIGKTHFGLALSLAIATKGAAFKYQAPKRLNVLHIDAEMDPNDLKDWLYQSLRCAKMNPDKLPDNFRLMCIEDFPQASGIFSLSNIDYWKELTKDVDVVHIDNLYSVEGFERSVRSNLSEIIKMLRRQNKTLIIQHHEGKNRKQLGGADKTYNVSTIIHLKKPMNWNATDGARFYVEYEKNRGFYGANALPYEARLIDDQWQIIDLVDVSTVRDILKTKILNMLKQRPHTTKELIDAFHRNVRGSDLKEALQDLETEGIIIHEKLKTAGRPAHRYSVA